VIIGAGIGGLAAGAILRRDGHEVTVLERAERFEPLGAGLALWPNGARALSRDRRRRDRRGRRGSSGRRWDKTSP